MSHIDRVGDDRRFWVDIYNIAKKHLAPAGAICYTSIYLLLLWHYKAIEITTDKITGYKARIEHENIYKMCACI